LGGGSVCDPDRVEGCTAGDPRLIGEADGEGSPLVFSEYSMYSTNLVNNEDYVRLIEEVRGVCSTSPVPAYLKGTGFLYWEQYIGLQKMLFFNIIYTLIAVFFVTFFMLLVVPKVERDKIWTLIAAATGGAGVLIFVLTLYIIEIYGFMG
jgi:patched 2 protein